MDIIRYVRLPLKVVLQYPPVGLFLLAKPFHGQREYGGIYAHLEQQILASWVVEQRLGHVAVQTASAFLQSVVVREDFTVCLFGCFANGSVQSVSVATVSFTPKVFVPSLVPIEQVEVPTTVVRTDQKSSSSHRLSVVFKGWSHI